MKRFFLMIFLFLGAALQGEGPKKWMVYYSNAISPEEMNPYQLVVLDSDIHPLLDGFIESERRALGYISVGEIEKQRGHFKEAEKKGLLLEENKNWPGSYKIDIRDPKWAKMVIEELVPKTLFQRFDGIFLDTLDSALYLEEEQPEKYAGMREAAIRLVRAIRKNYPEIKIMVNRAYDILPEIAGEIDQVLGESVYTTYDFERKLYRHTSEEEYAAQVAALKKAKKENPELELYTLDYWDPEDKEEIKKIYRIQRENGFIPYVATIDLHKIVPEPT